MNDPTNRTFVCSVLFLDIVEYSRRSVAEQMRAKQRFNSLLARSLECVAAEDRIVLDTGDGAAVSFLGNPEDALRVAMAMRSAIVEDSGQGPERVVIRSGLNLGAVRLIRDFNGHLNIIGDAINVAQRVMSFADPGQLLVSRSYYEVIYRLDPHFEKLFHYEGARTDKHVREHELYAVGESSAAWPSGDPRAAAKDVPPASAGRLNRRLFLALPAAMLLVVAAGVVIRVQRSPPVPEDTKADVSQRFAKRVADRRAHADVSSSTGEASRERQSSRKGETREDRQSARRVAEDKAQAVVQQGSAAAQLFIVPWGEVFVDGQKRGVSPPLRVLELKPGQHRIEIRNGEFPAHMQDVNVQDGERVAIRHRFN